MQNNRFHITDIETYNETGEVLIDHPAFIASMARTHIIDIAITNAPEFDHRYEDRIASRIRTTVASSSARSPRRRRRCVRPAGTTSLGPFAGRPVRPSRFARPDFLPARSNHRPGQTVGAVLVFEQGSQPGGSTGNGRRCLTACRDDHATPRPCAGRDQRRRPSGVAG
jgi:hypothetical protein